MGLAWSGAPALAQTVAMRDDVVSSERRPLLTLSVAAAPLKEVLRAIASQAGLVVAYGGIEVEKFPHLVTLSMQDVPASKAFEMALEGTGFQAQIVGTTVVFAKVEGASVNEGGVIGRIIDAKTKLPLRGATVTVDEAKKGVMSADNGTFRLPSVPAGQHVLRVRLLGYTRVTQTITVVDGETVTADAALTSSANQLEQVVVTGTVIPTELKAVPNAITVITGKELEQRGVTRIYELFHGDVPGLFINRTGQEGATNPGGVVVVSRGMTNLFGTSSDPTASTEGVKTYVDGVELANKNFLGMIDPKSVERIEIVTGPQAATIYGSNAINGVIQIFTKRGTSVRPQLTTELRSGWTQNSLNSALAPRHEANAGLNGVEGRVSYNVGTSWLHEGSWVPAVLGQTLSGYGGVRMTVGPLSADATIRQSQSQNSSHGRDGQVGIGFAQQGIFGNGSGVSPDNRTRTNSNEGMGLSATYQLTSWWSHAVTVGLDHLDELQQFDQANVVPSDTGYQLYHGTTKNLTVSYNTTLQVPFTSFAKAIVTVGADERHGTNEYFTGLYNRSGGAYVPAQDGGWQYNKTQAHEHGGFLQSQLWIADALFVTYGLRAVFNPNIGADKNPNWEPTYGVAYSIDVLGLTAKMRASYGTATRPPGVGDKDQGLYPGHIDYYGTDVYRLANPDLIPSSQQGGEGGLDLFLGSRASLNITHYNQTVDNLIVSPVVDSVDVLPKWLTAYPQCAAFKCPFRQIQNINIGSVRNQGWETRGTLNLGPFVTTGTYSWTRSRLIGITPRYRLQFPYYVKGSSFGRFAEHTYAFGLAYAHGGTRIGYNLQGSGQEWTAETLWSRSLDFKRLNADKEVMRLPDNAFRFLGVQALGPVGELNVSHQLTKRMEVLLRIDNVANSFRGDVDPLSAQPGRNTSVGLRMRF